MLNKKALQAVTGARFEERFTRPLHDSYCFSGIPGSLFEILTGQAHTSLATLPTDVFPDINNLKQVVLFLVDGLGWQTLAPLLGTQLPGLSLFEQQGMVSPLTCQYPSTTAVHSVTMYSGLPLAEAGVVEWLYFEPRIGRVITPFFMNYAGDSQLGTLFTAGFSTATVFPASSFYRTLADQGITPWIYSSAAYTPSAFSRHFVEDSQVVPFASRAHALDLLAERLAQNERAYHYVYLDSVDNLQHLHGPSSPIVTTEVQDLFREFSEFFRTKVPPGTLVLLTADHGQVDQPNDHRVLSINQLWPGISEFLKPDSSGQPRAPAGGAGRNLMLPVLEEAIPFVQARLKELLQDKASVFLRTELEDIGVFSRKNRVADFAERVGDIIVIAHPGQAVWWYEENKFWVRHKGNHGGLNHAEMEIPFLALMVGQ